MPNPPGGFFAHKQYRGKGHGQTGPDPHAILTVTLNKIANRLHLIRVTCQWRDKLYANNPPL